ncbi:unnamed protein product [Schistosoma margrebowiei]|uniref:Uncharacterized protein n=1 Tax=Schistosoma margrebowiei TaxID=48269 RepID=A0A183N858_9TREM|nr:unnamed protein product [Schistosoma margrebowiei]
MLVGGSRQETLDPCLMLLGTRQQGVPVILRELVLPGGFNIVSPSFTFRKFTTELSESHQILLTNYIFHASIIFILHFISYFVYQ